jgi:hypothetical protein
MSKATAREQARDKAQEISDLANLIRNAVDAGPEWEDQSAAIRAIRRALEGSAEVMIADRPETGLKSSLARFLGQLIPALKSADSWSR